MWQVVFFSKYYTVLCSHPAWLQVTKGMGGKTLNEEDYCTKNPGLSAMGPSAIRQENHSIILWMTVEAIGRANWFQLSQYPCCCRLRVVTDVPRNSYKGQGSWSWLTYAASNTFSWWFDLSLWNRHKYKEKIGQLGGILPTPQTFSKGNRLHWDFEKTSLIISTMDSQLQSPSKLSASVLHLSLNNGGVMIHVSLQWLKTAIPGCHVAQEKRMTSSQPWKVPICRHTALTPVEWHG